MKRAALLLLLLTCAACQQRAPDTVSTEAIDAVALLAEEELNGPPTAIMTLLRNSKGKPQIGWDQFVIGFDNRPFPVAEWLYDRGYINLAGVQYVTRPIFGLSEKTLALLAAPDQPWFEAEAAEPTAVDCRSPAAVAEGGCEIEVVLTPTLTPAGRAALGAAVLPPFTVRAVVASGLDGWEVPVFTPVSTTPQDLALNALLGPEETREARTAATLKRVQSQLGLDVPTDAEPPAPTNYVEPDAPVLPVEASGRPF